MLSYSSKQGARIRDIAFASIEGVPLLLVLTAARTHGSSENLSTIVSYNTTKVYPSHYRTDEFNVDLRALTVDTLRNYLWGAWYVEAPNDIENSRAAVRPYPLSTTAADELSSAHNPLGLAAEYFIMPRNHLSVAVDHQGRFWSATRGGDVCVQNLKSPCGNLVDLLDAPKACVLDGGGIAKRIKGDRAYLVATCHSPEHVSIFPVLKYDPLHEACFLSHEEDSPSVLGPTLARWMQAFSDRGVNVYLAPQGGLKEGFDRCQPGPSEGVCTAHQTLEIECDPDWTMDRANDRSKKVLDDCWDRSRYAGSLFANVLYGRSAGGDDWPWGSRMR